MRSQSNAFVWLLMVACAGAGPLHADAALEVRLLRNGPTWTIAWPAQLQDSQGQEQLPLYEVQRSYDLKTWVPVGARLRGSGGNPGELLSMGLPANADRGFFRVVGLLPSGGRVAKLGQGGAEVFGYGAAFDEELERIGQISPQEFAARFSPPSDYLGALEWDPTTAEFWAEFNVDPARYNQGLIADVDDLRLHDFRLNAEELALFKKNGFVVSERLGGPSFGEVLGWIWVDDLPVYIAADPLLHAWHRSYVMMLAELEETFLFENVNRLLEGMAAKLGEAAAQAGQGPLTDSVRDADYFLTVARSLLAGKTKPSELGQDARVAAALKAIDDLEFVECFDLFGQPRGVDFSQFKVRGHYTDSEMLGRYFRSVMWLGRMDLRVAGGPLDDSPCIEPHMASPRELGTAIVLHHLLRASDGFERWRQFDRLIQTFVGWTDSMTFGQLGGLLQASGINTLADVRDLSTLTALQEVLANGQLGVQAINSDFRMTPLGPEKATLPQSFTVFGQKFILDSWALGKTVFDSVIWDEDGIPTLEDKVLRRVPTGLDVAFSVFGNNHIVPELVARITDEGASRHIFRDGWPYQHNLAAVRAVIEQHPASSWNQNLYMGWLATLRELSAPTTGAQYPDAARTRAWAMKDLNSQLASWTQLRHDTVLYAKQSYTVGFPGCSYPKGFVDPQPNFWRRFRDMAQSAVKLIEATDYHGQVRYEFPAGSGTIIESNLENLKERHSACFQRFVNATSTLMEMSERELREEPFTQEQMAFLESTLHGQPFGMGWGGSEWFAYDGWYPKLFYRPLSKETPPDTPKEALAQDQYNFQREHGALRWDALVTDVHTDLPCPDCPIPDPGSVLHEGIGRVHLMMVAINNGPDRCVYAGPVFSHYEFEKIGPPERMSDPEWKELWTGAEFGEFSRADDGRKRNWSDIPHNPEWTRSYLAPIRR